MGAVMDLLKSTYDIHSTWPQSKRSPLNSCIRRACARNHVRGASDWNYITRPQGVIQEKAVSSDSKYGSLGKARKIGLLNFIDFQCQERERLSNMAEEIFKRLVLAGSGIFSSEASLKGLIHSYKVNSSQEECHLTDLVERGVESFNTSACEEKQNLWGPHSFQKYLTHSFGQFVTVSSPAKRMKMANGSYCSPLITNRYLNSMFTAGSHQGIVNPVTQDDNISNLFLGLNLASELVSPNSDKTNKTLRNGLQSKTRKSFENDLGKSKQVPSASGAKSHVCRRILCNEQDERHYSSGAPANVSFPDNCFMSDCKFPTEEAKLSDIAAEKSMDKNSRRKKARPSSKKRRRHKQKQTDVIVTQELCNGDGEADELNDLRDDFKVESLPAWNAQGINHLSRTKRRCRKIKSPCHAVKSLFTCSPTKNNAHLAFIFLGGTDSDASNSSLDSANEELWDSFQFHSDPYNPMNFGSAEVVFKSSSIPTMSTRFDDSPRRWSWSPSSRKDYIPSSKKVHFAREESLVTEHSCISLDEERKGPWEEFARDRCRFKRRIEEVENAIGYCLQTDHRHKILSKLNHRKSESD